MASFSTGLRTALLGTDGLSELLDEFNIYIYSGAVPESADAEIPDASTYLMGIVTADAEAPLEWGTPSEAVITKDPGQTWTAAFTNSPAADMAFFRVAPATYSETQVAEASTALYRIQGTIGLSNADMIVGVLEKVDSDELVINYFSVALPTL